jgi:hypothetical protein
MRLQPAATDVHLRHANRHCNPDLHSVANIHIVTYHHPVSHPHTNPHAHLYTDALAHPHTDAGIYACPFASEQTIDGPGSSRGPKSR